MHTKLMQLERKSISSSIAKVVRRQEGKWPYNRRADLWLDVGEEEMPPEIEKPQGLCTDLVTRRKTAGLGVDLLVPRLRRANEVDNTDLRAKSLHSRRVGIESLSNAVVSKGKVTANVLGGPV